MMTKVLLLGFAGVVVFLSSTALLKAHTIKPNKPKPINMANVHEYVCCDGCGVAPVVGVRYKCSNCTNFDLCDKCYGTNAHNAGHIFIAIRSPIAIEDQNRRILQVFPEIGAAFVPRHKFSSHLLHDLRCSVRGNVITQQDDDYNDARQVWNTAIDKFPIAIVQCRGVADIKKAVLFAIKHKLDISIRGGGHSIAGYGVCEKGLVIDLSLMRTVRVLQQEKVAIVDGGALWQDLDQECQIFGLGLAGGLISTTGVGGLTLGGGMGWLTRSYGLACDNLIEAQVVLANGELVTASATENSDLFWGLRGGGGNFGVVTTFKFQLHTIGEDGMIWLERLSFPLKNAQMVFAFYAKWALNAPRKISCFAFLDWNLTLMFVCNGSQKELEEATIHFKKLGVDESYLEHLEYATLQSTFNKGNASGNFYWSRSTFLAEMHSEKLIASLFQLVDCLPKNTNIEVVHLGGAFADVSRVDTAFCHRHAIFELHAITKFSPCPSTEEVVAVKAWASRLTDTLQEFSIKNAGYVNIGVEGYTNKAYGENFERLRKVKSKYDPYNTFHINHNIVPM